MLQPMPSGKFRPTLRRPRFNSWVGKIRWRRDRLPTPVFLGFPGGSAGKESTCNAGDLGSIPGLGRSPGEGKDYPLQYSGLENSMDRIVCGIAKSRTRLSNFHSLTHSKLQWTLVSGQGRVSSRAWGTRQAVLAAPVARPEGVQLLLWGWAAPPQSLTLAGPSSGCPSARGAPLQ